MLAGEVHLKLVEQICLLEVLSSSVVEAVEGESQRRTVSLWPSFFELRIWLVMRSVQGAGWKGTLCRLRSWLVVGTV